jgi:hypothetical protein
VVNPSDEIWILIGFPTSMLLRRNGVHFTVVSPACIFNDMNGQGLEGVDSRAAHGSYVLGREGDQWATSPCVSWSDSFGLRIGGDERNIC